LRLLKMQDKMARELPNESGAQYRGCGAIAALTPPGQQIGATRKRNWPAAATKAAAFNGDIFKRFRDLFYPGAVGGTFEPPLRLKNKRPVNAGASTNSATTGKSGAAARYRKPNRAFQGGIAKLILPSSFNCPRAGSL